MSATKTPSLNNMPYKDPNTSAINQGSSVQAKFGVDSAIEAPVTGKTLATPGLFGTKPKFFAGNTPSSLGVSSYSFKLHPTTNKSMKNRNFVMSANALVDTKDTVVLPESTEQEEASQAEPEF